MRELDPDERDTAHRAFQSYLDTIPQGKRFGSISYRVKDLVGRTGFGIGSAGLPASTILVEGRTQALLDLEHWAAFRTSFDHLTRLIASTAKGDNPPATIAVLSGEVHHAYLARATFVEPVTSPVYQLTCSPMHNTVPRPMRLAFRAGWWAPLSAMARWWAGRAGVPAAPVDWSKISGPHFGNLIGTIDLSGPTAVATIERATDHGLAPLPDVVLSSPPPRN